MVGVGYLSARAAGRAAMILKVYPLPILDDLRKPHITSGFGPRKRRDGSMGHHDGCDLFYRWQVSDGKVKLGDGGAARDWSAPGAPPKWFIPSGINAIAAALGHVSSVGLIRTGHHVWITHPDGHRTGYFHLRSTLVTLGQVVALGTPLGLVGDNPVDIDAQHLHFEVSPIDRYRPIDPQDWLIGALYYAPPPPKPTASK